MLKMTETHDGVYILKDCGTSTPELPTGLLYERNKAFKLLVWEFLF